MHQKLIACNVPGAEVAFIHDANVVVEFVGGRFNHLDMGIIVIALLVLYPIFFAIVGWRIAFKNQVKWLTPIICAAIFFISAYLSIFIHIFMKHLKQRNH